MPKYFGYVAAAYSAIWVVLLGYMLVIGSRIAKVEQQITLLKEDK